MVAPPFRQSRWGPRIDPDPHTIGADRNPARGPDGPRRRSHRRTPKKGGAAAKKVSSGRTAPGQGFGKKPAAKAPAKKTSAPAKKAAKVTAKKTSVPAKKRRPKSPARRLRFRPRSRPSRPRPRRQRRRPRKPAPVANEGGGRRQDATPARKLGAPASRPLRPSRSSPPGVRTRRIRSSSMSSRTLLLEEREVYQRQADDLRAEAGVPCPRPGAG